MEPLELHSFCISHMADMMAHHVQLQLSFFFRDHLIEKNNVLCAFFMWILEKVHVDCVCVFFLLLLTLIIFAAVLIFLLLQCSHFFATAFAFFAPVLVFILILFSFCFYFRVSCYIFGIFCCSFCKMHQSAFLRLTG